MTRSRRRAEARSGVWREAPAALITGEYSRPSGTMLKRYPGGKLCEPTVTELFN